MLKLTTLILGTLVSLTSFASTHGGGILAVGDRLAAGSELVYHMGENDGVVRFAYGQLHNGEWIFSESVDSVDSVIENSELVKALTESQLKNDWVQVND